MEIKKHIAAIGMAMAVGVTGLATPSSAEAFGIYDNLDDYEISALNNDPNYPYVYVFQGIIEYIDLSSAVITKQQGHLSEFAVCYLIGDGTKSGIPITRQGVLKFRYISGGSYKPQFYDEKIKEWITFPYYDYRVVKRLSNADFNKYFRPFEYYAFKIVYKKLFGNEFVDGMQGKKR